MNSNLQDKLQQFSATPPDGVWNKIADALDEKETYTQRLFQYEEQPPLTVWPQIETALESTAPAKVIPLKKRFNTPMRYMAVASILAVFLVTITLTVRRTRAGDLDAENHSASDNTSIQSAKQPDTYVTQTATEDPAKENASGTGFEKNTETTKAADNTPSTRTTSIASNSKPSGSSVRYLLYNGDDGKVVKVSKKMANLLHCKDGDSDCQQRLKQLRQTMATNAMTADFTGILEMLRHLQQKP